MLGMALDTSWGGGFPDTGEAVSSRALARPCPPPLQIRPQPHLHPKAECTLTCVQPSAPPPPPHTHAAYLSRCQLIPEWVIHSSIHLFCW